MNKSTREKYSDASRMDSTHRITLVKEIFSTVGRKYDFLNHLLSARRDIFWRRYAARELRFFKTGRLLDLATGTADLAIEAARYHTEIHVTGLDFVKDMVDLGVKKIKKRGFSSRISMLMGDALHLPFPTDSFDATAMAFGIRNIPDRDCALREMSRVTVPGGRGLIVEISLPQNRSFTRLYNLYLNRVLPLLAGFVSPNPAAYEYLADSVMNFPKPIDFVAQMRNSGFRDVTIYPLTMGIAHLYVGTVGPGE